MSRHSQNVTRREMLNRSLAMSAMAAAQLSWPNWMPRLAFRPLNSAPRGDVMVCVFLRGGADGLNIIVPHSEDAYYAARPIINIARPDDKSVTANRRALDLDGFFGLNPAAAPLLPIFKGGGMVAIHAAGSPDPTRSHFDAMDYMERGTPGSHALSTGWLGRHLASLDTGNSAPWRAIGWGNTLQQSLRGTVNATALKSIVDYHLAGRTDAVANILATINSLYGSDGDTLKQFSDQTNAVLDLVSKINIAAYQADGGATYNDDDAFSLALMQTAALIKADVGLEISAIDVGGWDTHHGEEPDLTHNLEVLSNGLAAFHTDMGDQMKNITLVVMSEFGRRVQENASGGTDHGHGNAMYVMGGHVVGKPVITNWPTLDDSKLFDGDLAVTIDYRDVLSEIVAKRLNNPAVDQVFPNFTATPRGVITT